MQKVPCQKCGVQILPTTAAKNGGLCVPCKTGTRESIERSRAYYREERELDRTDPERLYWKALVNRVYDPERGFGSLSRPEQNYFATHILLGEVYSGGFYQFFDNNSGAYCFTLSEALLELGAKTSLNLLREAKKILFAGRDIPADTRMCRELLSKNLSINSGRLEELDRDFWTDPDSLYDKLAEYAAQNRLF